MFHHFKLPASTLRSTFFLLRTVSTLGMKNSPQSAAARKDTRQKPNGQKTCEIIVARKDIHLTNTTIAVRKDIQYCFSIFFGVRNKTQPLQSAKTYDLLKHLLSDLLHLTNTTIAVRKDIQYCFYIFSLSPSPQSAKT